MSFDNYPWNILDIDETDDKKIIKKAYAVLLKKYKPDEFPDKFQEIQLAYKSALNQLKWNNPNSEESPASSFKATKQTQSTEFSTQSKESDDDSISDSLSIESEKAEKDTNFYTINETIKKDKDEFPLQPAKNEEAIFSNQDIIQQEQIADSLFQQIHVMAFAPIKIKSKLKNWNFLQNFHQITDLRLKEEVSRIIFQKLGEYNLFQIGNNRTLLIDKKVIKYFEEIFEWSHQWEIYQRLFHSNIFNINFHFIDSVETKKVKKQSIFASRFSAYFKDLMIILFISVLTINLLQFFFSSSFSKNTKLMIMIILLFGIRLVSELISKYRKTLGKIAEKLIVTDIYGNICSYKQSIIRNSILIFQLIVAFNPYWITDFIDISSEVTIFYSMFGILITNLIFFSLYNQYIHDFISKTYVIHQLAFANQNE